MCGIAGVLDPDEDRAAERTRWLLSQQGHRGPDHSAALRVGPATLGIARLAIMTPTAEGNQPLTAPAGSVVAVFNGEIYNHVGLARWLGVDGVPGSDGRVIPALLERHGVGALGRLRGMFGFAAVDLRRGQLLLGRDQLGIKPLYVRRCPDGTIAFASELRPLVGLGPIPPVRAEAVARFLHLGALGGDDGPFEDIEAVPAGGWVAFDEHGGCTRGEIRAADDPLVAAPPHPAQGSSGFRLRAALLETVAAHVGADVPTSLLLSAGTDSTALAWAVRELGTTVTCLTVAAEPGMPGVDEAPRAAATAAAYGHRHRVVEPRLADADLDGFFRHMQRPTIDGLNSWVVCRAVRDAGFKVALSGLGGDEALGGYQNFRLLRALGPLRALDRLRRPPLLPAVDALADAVTRRLPDSSKGRALLAVDGPRSAWELDLLIRAVWPLPRVVAATGVPLRRLGYLRCPDELVGLRSSWALTRAELDLYLGATLLPDTDAFSMAHSVEVRVPFVDLPFLTAATAAASRRPVGKAAFAAVIADPVLTHVASQPKQGFSVPIAAWMRSGPLRGLVDAVRDPHAPVWAHVDPVAGRAVLDAADLPAARWSHVWALAALNGWLESVAAQPVLPAGTFRIPAQARPAARAHDRAAGARGTAVPDAG
jgi:asparagine synthase (glutamine-hydrolysing)